MANNQRKSINSVCQLETSFQNISHDILFYVSDTLPDRYDVILGMDFCRKFNLQICFSDNSAIILPVNISPILFTANEDVILPPRDIGVITVGNDDIETGQILLEMTPKIISSTPLFCPQALTSIESYITNILVSNEGTEPFVIPKGMTLFQTSNSGSQEEKFYRSQN